VVYRPRILRIFLRRPESCHCTTTPEISSVTSTVQVTPAHFRRVNSQSVSRLFIWDLWGRDGVDHSTPLTVVPSEDVRPTQNQRDLYANNMHNDYNKQRSVRVPLVTHFLSTGLYASEYVVGSQGPLAYDGNNWSEIWHLLHRFLLHFHQCLVKEHDLAVRAALCCQ